MDALPNETRSSQFIDSSEQSSKKRKLEPDHTPSVQESTSGLPDVPPRARFKQHRPRFSSPDPPPGDPTSSLNASTSGSATHLIPLQPETAPVPKNHEHHPVDAKFSSLLRQLQDVVAESGQSRVKAERECAEREHELEAQISGLTDERDRAVEKGLEKEAKLKTLSLDLCKSGKQRKDLQLELKREREGRSGMDVRLKELAEEKGKLENELNDIRTERHNLSQTLEHERQDAKEMLHQVFTEHQAANDELQQFLLEHLSPKGRTEQEESQAFASFFNGKHAITASFDHAETNTTTTSLQEIVSRKHWTDWLDYAKEDRASALTTLRRKRMKTVEALEEERNWNREELERVCAEHEAIRKELEGLCQASITIKISRTSKTSASERLLREQHDALQEELEDAHGERMLAEEAAEEAQAALKKAQESAETQIASKVSLLRSQDNQALKKRSRELDKRAKLLEAEQTAAAEALAETQKWKAGYQNEREKRVALEAALEDKSQRLREAILDQKMEMGDAYTKERALLDELAVLKVKYKKAKKIVRDLNQRVLDAGRCDPDDASE